MTIILLEKPGHGSRNRLVFFDRFGKKQFAYEKLHACDFDVKRTLTLGDGFYITALVTACGKVNVGGMICYGREFPKSARILMLQGAELILVPNACPMEINRLAKLQTRLFEKHAGDRHLQPS